MLAREATEAALRSDNTTAVAASTADVRAAMAEILKSPSFARAPRMARFLTYGVERALEGRSDDITGYAIGLDVFDRGSDFDPSVDSIVRVEARRLRRTLAEYYAADGIDSGVRIELATGSYVPVFRRHQSLPEEPSTPAEPPPRHTVLAAGRRPPALAVLPLTNLSSHPADQVFCDGLTEQIICTLARFQDLTVISRSTVEHFARSVGDVRTLASDLNVDFVLEGSVQKSADRVRIGVRLVDGGTAAQLWGETFDRTLTATSLFDIQDEIGEMVGARIADCRSSFRRRQLQSVSRTENLDAYCAVLLFHDNYSRHQAQAHLEARNALLGAVEADPGYADAWAALAAVYLDEYRFELNRLPSPSKALDRALEAALLAASMAPDNPMAQQFLACTYFHRGEFDDFRIAAERALRLNPSNPDLLADIATCLILLEEPDEGLTLLHKAMSLNPVHPGWYHSPLILIQYLAGDFEAALKHVKLGYMPGHFWSHIFAAATLGELGRTQEAEKEVACLLDVRPDIVHAFESEARKWHASDAAIAAISTGLRKAGLQVHA